MVAWGKRYTPDDLASSHPRAVQALLSLTLIGDRWASGPTPPQGDHKGPHSAPPPLPPLL